MSTYFRAAMEHVHPVRRLDVGVQLKRLPLPQERDPALDNLWPRRIRPFPLDRLVLGDRQLPGHLRHRAVGEA